MKRKEWDITERMIQGQFAADDVHSDRLANMRKNFLIESVNGNQTKTQGPMPAKYKGKDGMRKAVEAFNKNQKICVIENWPHWFTGQVALEWAHSGKKKAKDAKFGEWSKPFPGPDQTQVRFYREMKNGKVIGIKEIKTATGGLQKIEIPLEEVNWHLKDTKDAKSESEWDLKFRLRHALPGETMSNKLGTVRSVLAREGFDRNFKSYGDRVFSATHSRMGFTVNIETEPTDDSRKVLKIRQVWFSDSKPTKDAPEDPKLLSNKEIYAELKTHPDKRREQALMNELKRRATLARRDYEGLANYMNGDSMMNGANYRPALDAALTKDAAADGRETWKWDTMFMDLAEKVYNKLQMAGITSNVRKNGQYYHIEAKVTPDERKKIEFFIKGHTIHSVGGYRSMDYPGK